MSLRSLAQAEINRRRPTDQTFGNAADDRSRERLRQARSTAPATEDPALPEGSAAPTETPVTNALAVLIKYIPTEAVMLYVAAVSAAPAVTPTFRAWREDLTTPGLVEGVYWVFGLGLTPTLLLLIYFNKRHAAGLKPLVSPKEWPWWKVVASMIAFLVWAPAVPGHPWVGEDAGRGVLAGMCALFVSTALVLIEPLVERKPA